MIKELVQRRFFVTLIFGFSLFIFLLISYVSQQNTQLLRFNMQQLIHSNENLLAYEAFISIMKDAETGQRGYIITNDTTYLEPYTSALDSVNLIMGRLKYSVDPNDSLPQQSLRNINRLVRRRLFVLEAGIWRRRVQGLEAATTYLKEGAGKVIMDSLRQEVKTLASLEHQKLAIRNQMAEKSSEQAIFTRQLGTVVSVLLLLWAFLILRKQMQKRKEALELLERVNNELEQKVQARTRDLQKTTEELATSNEELQATMEELSASTEEIIAGNEELTTSNEQLGHTLEQLDTTSRQLQLALESARMGSWHWDITTGTIAWSEGLEEVHGLKKGAFQSIYGGNLEGFRKLVHPQDRDRLTEAVSTALREKSIYDTEFRIVWPDGSVHWLLGRGMGYYDNEGNAIAMQGIGMDITERKEAENALFASEQRYRDLFENNPQPMWIYDVDTLEFVEVNQAALQKFGYTKEAFFAKKATGLASPQEMPSVLHVVEKVKSNDTIDRRDEWVLETKDKSQVHVISVSHALPPRNGQKTRIVLINDITERKLAEEKLRESEAKLRRLYDVGLMGVNYWRQDGTITESNDYFLQMVGYSRQELQRGEVNWRTLTLPGYETGDEEAKKEMDIIGFCTPYEKAYRCKDGRIIHVLIGAASLAESQREDGIAFILDTTERKAAEEQLRKSQILLQTIFEASADALFLINVETELIEEYNQQAVHLFDFQDKQHYVGKRGAFMEADLFTELKRAPSKEEIHINNNWTTEIEFTSQKGRKFWGNVAVSFFGVDSKSYYLVRVRDVTERQAIYEEIKRSQLELLGEKRKTEQQLSIIEADNLRKTNELEEARNLQLSMLPSEPPKLPNITMASYMKTCVEVGGDYYDYKLDEDGTLTVIVGDATGHGLKAGIVVATVKSYFQTLAGRCDVVELLKRISEGIFNLQIRAMYMGVTVIEVKGHQLHMASSGMPPLYVYRKATQTIESIVLKGPFLGSTLPTPYNHITKELQPGDSLLVLTDGLPELFNKDRVMLDYPSIQERFNGIGHLPATDIITELVTLGDAWAAGKANEDDITLLVLKAK